MGYSWQRLISSFRSLHLPLECTECTFQSATFDSVPWTIRIRRSESSNGAMRDGCLLQGQDLDRKAVSTTVLDILTSITVMDKQPSILARARQG